MMRTLNLSLFAAAMGLVASVDADAHGLRRRACADDCPPAPCVTTAAPAAPAAPQYEERKVTRYKTVTKERVVEEVVCRSVPREEKYTYTVCVPRTHEEVRKVSVQVPHYREVECKYTVTVPYTVKEMRTVVECIPTYRDVEYTYCQLVPRVEKTVVKQTVMQRNVRHVEEDVRICRMVRETCTDECGRCTTVCRPVYDTVKVKRCVVDCVPVVRDVEVCRTVCDRVERKGVRRVCDLHRQERQVEVCVIRCKTEERVGKRTVCDYVTEVRDQKFMVCTYDKQERTGVRTVYDRVQDKVKRTVQYTECVPYEETIRVPVSHCVSDCDSGCGQRRGLFSRCCR